MSCCRISSLGMVSGLLASALPAQPRAVQEFVHLEPVLRAAMDSVAPAVVTVETFGGVRKVLAGGGAAGSPAPKKKGGEPEKEPRPLVQPGFLQAQGATTGVVLTSDGWILVSRFALNYDPTTILITLADGRSFHAKRAGEDTSRGVALVKIDAGGLAVPEFVAPESIAVGQWAFALGRTFGRTQPSVHMGILSAAGRLFGRALQTDAYTSPANYGGPLIDIDGRVLGIVVPLSRAGRDAGAELYDSGIGFAATIADIGELIERMKAGEVLHRGWLGVSTDPLYLGPGARISATSDDSPASATGIVAGELVVGIDGRAVRNSFHLHDLISAKMGGDRVELELIGADGGRRQLTVTLADLPAAERQSRDPADEAGVLPWEEGDGGEGHK